MKYLILAGGSGTRLWPLSRKSFAKQFLNLTNDYSMLQNTAKRVSRESGKDIFVISNQDSKFIINDQLTDLFKEFQNHQMLVEPVGRNTAPAIAYSCLYFNDDDIVAVLSSDHHIKNDEEFNRILGEAEKIASKGNIVTLGIIPDQPKTGYGYIKKTDHKVEKGFKVDCFVEKPTLDKAQEYLAAGGYFWNAGIFIFQVKTFLAEIKRHCPDIDQVLQELKPKIKSGGTITREDFMKFPNISVDYAVMEKSSLLVVIPSDFGWSDVGSFHSLYEILDKDDNGNAVKSEPDNFVNINSSNLLVYGSDRKIAAINLKDLVIIDTEDALLISDSKKTENVKEIVQKLQEQKSETADHHVTVYRPWGSYTVLEKGKNFQVKVLHINPKKRISLQYHKHRSETWTVVEGVAEVTKGEDILTLHPSESVFIPANTNHRLSNPLNFESLKIIEVQTGSYLGEDDIIRLEDDYSRK